MTDSMLNFILGSLIGALVSGVASYIAFALIVQAIKGRVKALEDGMQRQQNVNERLARIEALLERVVKDIERLDHTTH